MDNRGKILQIVENSGCLSKSQFNNLLHHKLHPEELRVVELHLSSCTICSDALEGFELFPESYDTMQNLTISILGNKKQDNTTQHKSQANNSAINSTIIDTKISEPKKVTLPSLPKIIPSKLNVNFKNSGIAIGIIGVFVLLLWFMVFSKSNDDKKVKETLDQYVHQNVKGKNSDTLSTEKSVEKPINNNKEVAKNLVAEAVQTEDKAEQISKPEEKQEPEKQVIKEEPKKEEKKEETIQQEKKEAPPKQELEVKPESFTKPEKLQQTNASDYENAVTLFRDTKYASALLYFQSEMSNANSPKYWDAMYYAALCHKNMNNKEKATVMLQKIIDAKVPQSSQANRILEEL